MAVAQPLTAPADKRKKVTKKQFCRRTDCHIEQFFALEIDNFDVLQYSIIINCTYLYTIGVLGAFLVNIENKGWRRCKLLCLAT
jgi:hypothetical protein